MNPSASLSAMSSAEMPMVDSTTRRREVASGDEPIMPPMEPEMSLTVEDVDHVAFLARLALTDDERQRLTGELSSILSHIAVLERLDTSTIPPTAQVVSLSNVMRNDEIEDSFPVSAVLANAPRQRDGFFEVQAVLDTIDAITTS